MKTIRILVLSLLFTGAMSLQAAQPVYGRGSVSFNYFYDNLSRYGEWIRLDDGLVVWRPQESRSNWEPYTQGAWMWTDCGWYWNSDEPYGDIVYHYGRWHNDDYYGWIWVPDYEWAPAWVQWRYDDNYIGWTPLPPYAMFSEHSGISFTVGFNLGYLRWHFVPYRNFCKPYVSHYFVPGRVRYRIFEHTVVRNNYRYENNRVVDRSFTRDMFETRGRIRLNEQRINFRQTEGLERAQIRNNENRIEIAVPRERADRVDINNLTIKRGDRSATLQLDKVRIGERVRTTDNDRNNTQQNNRGTVTLQRNEQENRGSVVTPNRDNNTNRNNGTIATPNRTNSEPRSPGVRKEREKVQKEKRNEVRSIEKSRNESQPQRERSSEGGRESRTRER